MPQLFPSVRYRVRSWWVTAGTPWCTTRTIFLSRFGGPFSIDAQVVADEWWKFHASPISATVGSTTRYVGCEVGPNADGQTPYATSTMGARQGLGPPYVVPTQLCVGIRYTRAGRPSRKEARTYVSGVRRDFLTADMGTLTATGMTFFLGVASQTIGGTIAPVSGWLLHTTPRAPDYEPVTADTGWRVLPKLTTQRRRRADRKLRLPPWI